MFKTRLMNDVTATEGQRHLGAVIGSSKYKREYVQNKIDE